MVSAWDLVAHPPPGYRFVVRDGGLEAAARWAARFTTPYRFFYLTRPFLPLNLAKALWNSRAPVPPETDLIYAMQCLWFGREPWVLEMQSEGPHTLVGSLGLFRRFRERVRSALRSPYCRGIVYGLEAGKRALLQLLDGDELVEAKVRVIPWAVPLKPAASRPRDGKVRLLFVSSGNVHDLSNFDLKGGKEVVGAFRHLRQRYANLELIVRCPLTPAWRWRLEAMDGVYLYEKPLLEAEFEQLWRTADIFVQPTHITPSTAYLDALSYGLPVVTSDVWGNCELVEDGKTGFLVRKSRAAGYTDGWVVRYHSPEHKRDWHTLDEEVVEGLVERLALLIEDEGLRSRMSAAARTEIAEGQHSFKMRNAALKQFLDSALEFVPSPEGGS
ncbi:MAG: glycosyltransferase family 4 protein [Chloroflexi bacterium]|nr:glycosyltransferase family 4 protein [Chloroflexota bacterium]